MQEDYVRLFTIAIRALESRGVQFEPLARKILAEVIGGSSYEALSVLIGKESLLDPGVFAERLLETLDVGAVAIFNLIEGQAAEKVSSACAIPEVAEFEASARRVKFDIPIGPKTKPSYLHDHRIQDELEEYYSRLEG